MAAVTTAAPADVLADLRRTRRRHRTADIDVFEALYRAYLTAIVVGLAFLLLSGVTGDGRVTAATLHRVRRDGAAAVGMAAALAVALGLRSGGRGGPLVIEAADVAHVLLSPVDRSLALRGPAVRQLRFGAFAGAAVGSVAGLLAFRRLPGTPGVWVATGATAGACAALLALGGAMVVSGLRLGQRVANLLALLTLAWAGADLAAHTATSPWGLLGRLALWPLRVNLLGLLGVALAAGLAYAALAVVGGTSLEAAERRASLAGQLRFAATLQDVRTVIVLRRQLALERPRTRPWLRLGARRQDPRFPVWRRGWHGILRWPAVRVGRLAVLGAVAGACLVATWRGTTPMIVVAGLAVFVAGLDAVEPLAQELDHPDRADSLPVLAGELHLRQLGPSVVAMVAVSLVAGAAALALSRKVDLALPLAGLMAVPTAVTAAGAAAMSVVKGPPDAPSPGKVFVPPEAAGMRLVLRIAWPPALVVISLLPVLAARSAFDRGRPPVAAAAAAELAVATLAALVVGWVRFHEEVHAAIRRAIEAGGAMGGATGGGAGGGA